MAKPDHNAIVAKDHNIVDKMANFRLSELRLIAFCLSHYDSSKPDNRIFTATVEELTSIFPSMDEKKAYEIVRDAMLEINKKPLEFREGKKCHFWNWFTGFTYTKGEGHFEFRITPELQPYLLNLKGRFTEYRLRDVYQFTSASTWKLYEHLKKRWAHKKTWSVKLDDLKIELGIPGKYHRWQDFKKRVIDPAIKQINKTSDILVSYEKEKRTRHVIGVVFFVTDKPPESVIDVESDIDRFNALIQTMLRANIGKTQAQNFAEDATRFGQVAEMITLANALYDSYGKLKVKPCPLPKYMMGALREHLHQQQLPLGDPKRPEHAEALECWQDKRRSGEKCKVRERGTAGQRKKCQICLDKIPIDQFGI